MYKCSYVFQILLLGVVVFLVCFWFCGFFFSFNHQQFSAVAVQAPLYPQLHFAKHDAKKEIAFVKKFNVLN